MLLDVFDIINLELGIVFVFYGVVVMLVYLLGGFIVDCFSVWGMMIIVLVVLVFGGIYYVIVLGISGLKVLFVFWGLMIILLFWVVMICVICEWGGDDD